MALETGAFMQANSYSAEIVRRAMFAQYARTSANNPGIISGGLIGATDFQVSQLSSPNMSVNVSTGEAIVPGNEGGAQGGYYVRGTSTSNLAISTANPSNPRIDTVCLTCGDAQYTLPSGGTSGSLTLQVVTGTPTAGATLSNLSGAAALPGSSLLLGYVLVPAGASSIVTADIANKATVVRVQPNIPGTVLSSATYGPSTTSYTYASNTWTYPDTTNLAATFVVPPSGNVWVDAYGGEIQNNGATATLSGASTVPSGTPIVQMNMGVIGNSSSQPNTQSPYQFHSGIYGLTPGGTATLYLGIYCSGTNGTWYASTVTGGLAGGPVSIKVTSI